ncbi:hypothetical protein C8R46DRAFT_1067337 [Mycena filopes]|nr:hypothetical protein C8R46DRAFT_1067337 [Mycena filopes]
MLPSQLEASHAGISRFLVSLQFPLKVTNTVASMAEREKELLAFVSESGVDVVLLDILWQSVSSTKSSAAQPYLLYFFDELRKRIRSHKGVDSHARLGQLATDGTRQLHAVVKAGVQAAIRDLRQAASRLEADVYYKSKPAATSLTCPQTKRVLAWLRTLTDTQVRSRISPAMKSPGLPLMQLDPSVQAIQIMSLIRAAQGDLPTCVRSVWMRGVFGDAEDAESDLPSMGDGPWRRLQGDTPAYNEEFHVRLGAAVLANWGACQIRNHLHHVRQHVGLDGLKLILETLTGPRALVLFCFRLGWAPGATSLEEQKTSIVLSDHTARAFRLFVAALHVESPERCSASLSRCWAGLPGLLCNAYVAFARVHQARPASPLPEERTPKRRQILREIQSPSGPTSSTPASMDSEAAGVENSPGGASGDSPVSSTAARRPRKSATLLVAPAFTPRQSTPASPSPSPPTPASDSSLAVERGVFADASTAPKQDDAGTSSVLSLAPASTPRRIPEAERRRGVDGRTKIPEIRASTTPRPKALRVPGLLDVNMAPAARQTSMSAQGALEPVRPAATDISTAAASTDGRSRGMSETQQRRLVPGRTTISEIRPSTTPHPKALRVPGFPDMDLAPATTHDLSTASTECDSATTTHP